MLSLTLLQQLPQLFYVKKSSKPLPSLGIWADCRVHWWEDCGWEFSASSWFSRSLRQFGIDGPGKLSPQSPFVPPSGKIKKGFISWDWWLREQLPTVSFNWIWLILILNNLLVNSPWKEKMSAFSTSRPLGTFWRTLALPQASDWSVRRNSPSWNFQFSRGL